MTQGEPSCIELEVVSLSDISYICRSCKGELSSLRWCLVLTINESEYYVCSQQTTKECCGDSILVPDSYTTEDAGLAIARKIDSQLQEGSVQFRLLNVEEGTPITVILSPPAIH